MPPATHFINHGVFFSISKFILIVYTERVAKLASENILGTFDLPPDPIDRLRSKLGDLAYGGVCRLRVGTLGRLAITSTSCSKLNRQPQSKRNHFAWL